MSLSAPPPGSDGPLYEVAMFEDPDAYRLMLPAFVRRRLLSKKKALRLGAYALDGEVQGLGGGRVWPVVECRAVDRSWVLVMVRGKARDETR